MSNIDNTDLNSVPSLAPPTLEQLRASRQPSPAPAPARADQPGGLFSRLNPGELEEIEARLKAATDGPWTIYAGHTGIRNTLPYAWVGPEIPQWDGTRKIAPVVERANGGTMADMRFISHAREDVEKLINTINALSSRIARRFNETAQARQDAAAARERAESAERALEARGPMPDLGHLADAVAGRERLEREVNRLTAELFQARSGHVPGDEADLRRILADRQAQIEEYRRDAMERTKVVDQIRQRFGIEPGEDLFQGLCRKVGDLQTSEAELVSAPLKAQIEELTQANTYRETEIQALHTELAEQRQSVQARDRLLEAATREREEARQALKARETEVSLLEVALGDWRRAGEVIAKAVYDQDTVGALEYESYPPDLEKSWTKLAEVIKAIRGAMARYRPSTGS